MEFHIVEREPLNLESLEWMFDVYHISTEANNLRKTIGTKL